MLLSSFAFLTLFTALPAQAQWKTLSSDAFTIYAKPIDSSGALECRHMLLRGMQQVTAFFDTSFAAPFQIYIHPSRASLDSTWSADWNMPGFKSECWMVASGVSRRLDLLTRRQWKQEACDHDPADTTATQGLITHELVHVFHAQKNPGNDFANVDRLDWFVEGVAGYASGQLVKAKENQVIQIAQQQVLPLTLDDFWKGPLRYQQSAAMVRFIDKKWGRSTIISLLSFTSKQQVLEFLQTAEAKLIADFRQWLVQEAASH